MPKQHAAALPSLSGGREAEPRIDQQQNSATSGGGLEAPIERRYQSWTPSLTDHL